MAKRLISHAERWRYEYRGIEYEISKRHKSPVPFWAYYIHIPLDIMPPALRERFWLPAKVVNGHVIYGLQENDFLQQELSWHAGGPDYYEKVGGHDGIRQLVKIGCGYGGEWEKHIEYELENLEWQAQMTIDSLTRLVLRGPSESRP